jgi:hypothetical protein
MRESAPANLEAEVADRIAAVLVRLIHSAWRHHGEASERSETSSSGTGPVPCFRKVRSRQLSDITADDQREARAPPCPKRR